MRGDNILSKDDIIAQARSHLNEDVSDVLEACEAFYGHGFSDDSDGDVETFGHFYRVHRWIVWTDSQGFHDLETYDTEEDAVKSFGNYSRDYAKTFETGEDL